MNLNATIIKKKTAKNAPNRPAYRVNQVMGPPAPKTKSTSVSTPSTSTNWGRNTLINDSTLRSGGTTVSTDGETHIITALTEGRGDARCEVGLASIDLSHPTLILCQISDGQSYINTLTKINILNPTHILVPSTFLERTNRLIEILKKQFPQIKILGVPRKTFNKSYGMDKILQICLPAINTICVGLRHKYYALAATSALLTYLQNNLNVYYSDASVNVSYQQSEGYAIIDVATADRLELVACTKPAQATRFATLFGVLNYCKTSLGSRLLRSTILQPPCSRELIERTANCVSELIKHPQTLLAIQVLLQRLPNINQLLTLTTLNSANNNCSVKQLNYLLTLNSLMDLIQPLKDTLETCQQPLFQQLKQTLASDNFSLITEQIRAMIHPSAQFAKGNAGITQRCFAIKSGINGLLDLVRRIYSERLDDMSQYVAHLASQYNMSLSLANNNTKGYHIVYKLNKQQRRTMHKSDLPREFMQVYRLAGSFTMKTTELINYSTRLEDIMNEVLKISNRMIRELVADLQQHLGFFYKLCEDIAVLDMLQSLAESSRRGGYVRPKFGEFTELVNARHPMLELLIGEQRVANPISICKDFNVQIITGPNGSGKSIYIRQVMLLQVMAQVGCYVPADCALFRPMARMFARIYLEDSLEYGASSFVLEMREIKYMMSLLSGNSLFIIDELCRSTAADEGTALATAICEKFCTTSTFVYVTTHYKSLAGLSDAHLNVRTWQMETIATGETPRELCMDFKYKLIPGVTNLKHYGVYIVKKLWPERLLQEVYKILDKCTGRSLGCCTGSRLSDYAKLKYKLESDFRKLKSRGKLTSAAINKRLNEYQSDLQKMNIVIDWNQIRTKRGNEMNAAPVLETSSYQNLSNFLREDSDNINKLAPEVMIQETELESQNVENPTQNDAEARAIMEELESVSEFLSDDWDWDVSQASSYKTAENDTDPPQHLFPIVKVIEGPAWLSDSSSNDPSRGKNELSESISYSPLRSPTPKESTESNVPHTSTSSSVKVNEQRIEVSENTSTSDPKTVTKSTSETQENATSSISKCRTARPTFKKFVPPKKLTRKEIQDEFDEQNRKLYETDTSDSNFSKYYAQVRNRPSIRQIQRTEYLAFVRKTDEGTEVIPAPPKQPPKRSFLRKLSNSSNVNVSIFSDKHAKRFDEFINSDERDVKSLMFDFSSMDENKAKKQTFSFAPQDLAEYAVGGCGDTNLFNEAPAANLFRFNENASHSFSQSNASNAFSQGAVMDRNVRAHSFTPEGYYRDNRNDIDCIMNKYLGGENVFESRSFNDDDFQL